MFSLHIPQTRSGRSQQHRWGSGNRHKPQAKPVPQPAAEERGGLARQNTPGNHHSSSQTTQRNWSQPARLIPTLPGCDEVPQPPRAGVRGQEESRDFERWHLVTGPLVSAEPRLAWGHRAWRGQQLGTHALLSQRKPHGVPEPPPSGGVEPPPPWV